MADIVLRTGRLFHHSKTLSFNHIISRSHRWSRFQKNQLLANTESFLADEKTERNEEGFEFPKFKRTREQQEADQEVENLRKSTEFPSDAMNYLSKLEQDMNKKPGIKNNKDRYQANKAIRPKVDPRQTSILLFPGQGSQFVGMGRKLLKYPKVEEMYSIASKILGFDLLNICLNGPKEVLDKTIHCQAAVVVTSLAAVEKLKAEKPWAVEKCVTAAGYSVGEISALTFSGVMSFEDAVTLVKVRSKEMQNVSNEIGSGMMSVGISTDTRLKFACHAAKKFCSEVCGIQYPVCEITNYLHPGVKVIAGNNEALEFITRNAENFKIRRCTYLPVSGAFHSPIMRPAARIVKNTLLTLQLNKPIVPVHSNVTSKMFGDVDHIIDLVSKQICNPVMWEQTMHAIYTRPQDSFYPMTYEVGPGRQLGLILSKVNKKAFEDYDNIEV